MVMESGSPKAVAASVKSTPCFRRLAAAFERSHMNCSTHRIYRIGEAAPLPNESRLSCGAELEGSQGEFYHTARKTFSGPLRTGAASFKRWLGCAPQVIARVRPRQELRAALTVADLPWEL